MNIVACVFARGGSQGVPRKNLRTVGNKTLLRRAVEAGRGSRFIDCVYVSTDDAEIAAEARSCGADVPFRRPAELASNHAAEHAAWQHAVRTFNATSTLPNVDLLVSIPATVPLRTADDIDRCIAGYLDGNADVVITVTEAASNPYFNTVVMDDAGFVARVLEPPAGVFRRQDAPPVYQIVPAAFVCSGKFVLATSHYLQGRVQAVRIPRVRAVDIDSEFDLQWARFLCDRGTLDANDRAHVA